MSRNQPHSRSPTTSLQQNYIYRGSNTQRRRLHCQLCNKPGHESINCWHRGNQIDYPSHRPTPRDQPRQAHHASYPSLSTVMDPSWYFDSGAADHVTSDLNKLHITEPHTEENKLQLANGNLLLITHSGLIIMFLRPYWANQSSEAALKIVFTV